MMVKPDLGTKRLCAACGARFYDLGKTPAVCPKCHTEQPPDQPRPRRPTPPPAAEERRVVKPSTQSPETELEEGAETAEEDVMEDTSDLGDDPDTIGNEIEVGPGEEHDS